MGVMGEGERFGHHDQGGALREGSIGAETLKTRRSWSCEDLGGGKDSQAEGTARAKGLEEKRSLAS